MDICIGDVPNFGVFDVGREAQGLAHGGERAGGFAASGELGLGVPTVYLRVLPLLRRVPATGALEGDSNGTESLHDVRDIGFQRVGALVWLVRDPGSVRRGLRDRRIRPDDSYGYGYASDASAHSDPYGGA